MSKLISRVRRPVKREAADLYLLVTLLSFASSVTLTRLFLEITDYPQLGGNGFHIAHVLWGGVVLFSAALMPLVFANRWVYHACAILSGIGVGLFIDEVGKFITANNDYFHPLAAPIIYAFFLVTVLLYLQVRKPPSRNARAELYRSLDAMQEVLDHDLDPQEKSRLINRLEYVTANADHAAFANLANSLLEFLSDDTAYQLTEAKNGFLDSQQLHWERFEARWITRGRLITFLSGGLLALGVVSILNLLKWVLSGFSQASLDLTLTRMVESNQITSVGSLNWFAARLALEISVGLLLILGGILLVLGKEKLGTALGILGLLLSLAAVNLLIFYFDQFSSILTASAQFIVLIGLVYFRRYSEITTTPG